MMAQPLVDSDASRSDADLAAATRAGEASALAALYERHSQALFAVAYRLLNSRESAEDVIHVFVGLRQMGKALSVRGKRAEAVKMLRFSAETFAKSAKAQAALARGLELAGDRKAANESARRALALDANQTWAQEILRRVLTAER